MRGAGSGPALLPGHARSEAADMARFSAASRAFICASVRAFIRAQPISWLPCGGCGGRVFPPGMPVPQAGAGGRVFGRVCGAEATPLVGKARPRVFLCLALVLGHHLPIYSGISVNTLSIAKQTIK